MLYEHIKEKENVEKRTQVLYWGGLVFPLHFWKDNTSEVGQWHMLSVSITKNNNNKKNICRAEKFNLLTNGDNSGVGGLWKYASLFLLNKCACISSSYRNDYQHTHTRAKKQPTPGLSDAFIAFYTGGLSVTSFRMKIWRSIHSLS